MYLILPEMTGTKIFNLPTSVDANYRITEKSKT